MKSSVGIVRNLAIAASILVPCSAASAQLKPPRQPIQNPLTPEKALLGKILFWDEQLSSDGTMACGTCHQPRQGGSDPRTRRAPGPDGVYDTADDVYGSPGVIGSDASGHYAPTPPFGLATQVTGRHAPDFTMGSYFTVNFWDGRALSTFTDPQTGLPLIVSGGALESQLVNPPVGPVEMSDPGRTWNDVVKKLAAARPLALASDVPNDMHVAITVHPTYPDLFEWVFGDPAITSARVAFAIASYERSLVPDRTPWDRYMAGDQGALDDFHVKGLKIFNSSGRCILCHVPPLFSDDRFHNLGVRPPSEDMGLQKTTVRYGDRGRFKTPSLRDVGLRGRFMHDGRFAQLSEVIAFYARGGDFPNNRDPLMVSLNLTPTETFELRAFLADSLTDPRVAAEEAPFDRPTLHAEAAANPSNYGAASAGSGGFVPQMIAITPPVLGNPSFRVGVGDALGGSLAFLALAASAAPPGSTFNGIPLNVSITPLPILLTVALSGSGAGAGYGTAVMKLPNSPAFDGQTWYAQWFVVDPGVAAGLAASEGSRFEFFLR